MLKPYVNGLAYRQTCVQRSPKGQNQCPLLTGGPYTVIVVVRDWQVVVIDMLSVIQRS